MARYGPPLGPDTIVSKGVIEPAQAFVGLRRDLDGHDVDEAVLAEHGHPAVRQLLGPGVSDYYFVVEVPSFPGGFQFVVGHVVC